MLQGDIDKFKKMQQTTQSNRSSSKAASSAASPSRASSAKPAVDPIIEEVTDPTEAPAADPSDQSFPLDAGSETSVVTEAEQDMGRMNLRSLPPNGLSKQGSGRRERHGLHRPRPSKASRNPNGVEDNPHQSSEPVEVFQGNSALDGASSDVTRHGSFERDLAKLHRTRSHAKSESDLERPHQVSVTADGAGPPVTRAPLGS